MTTRNKSQRYPVKPRRRVPNTRLTELRINRGWSPNDLGYRVGVSGKAIRDAEAGSRPHPRLQLAIAEQFELLPTDLWPIDTLERVRV